MTQLQPLFEKARQTTNKEVWPLVKKHWDSVPDLADEDAEQLFTRTASVAWMSGVLWALQHPDAARELAPEHLKAKLQSR